MSGRTSLNLKRALLANILILCLFMPCNSACASELVHSGGESGDQLMLWRSKIHSRDWLFMFRVDPSAVAAGESLEIAAASRLYAQASVSPNNGDHVTILFNDGTYMKGVLIDRIENGYLVRDDESGENWVAEYWAVAEITVAGSSSRGRDVVTTQRSPEDHKRDLLVMEINDLRQQYIAATVVGNVLAAPGLVLLISGVILHNDNNDVGSPLGVTGGIMMLSAIPFGISAGALGARKRTLEIRLGNMSSRELRADPRYANMEQIRDRSVVLIATVPF